jgi:predicted regulator of Ras-like GTPase activity (Roadblock/LC7/MglB family)
MMEVMVMVKKKKDELEITGLSEPTVIGITEGESRLRANLEEIKKCDGVIGYILRNTTSASIDLKDPAKMIDYAILSSTAFDATEEVSDLFQLGRVNNIIVNGKNVRMLSLTVEENKISIFMENNADTEKVLEKLKES